MGRTLIFSILFLGVSGLRGNDFDEFCRIQQQAGKELQQIYEETIRALPVRVRGEIDTACRAQGYVGIGNYQVDQAMCVVANEGNLAKVLPSASACQVAKVQEACTALKGNAFLKHLADNFSCAKLKACFNGGAAKVLLGLAALALGSARAFCSEPDGANAARALKEQLEKQKQCLKPCPSTSPNPSSPSASQKLGARSRVAGSPSVTASATPEACDACADFGQALLDEIIGMIQSGLDSITCEPCPSSNASMSTTPTPIAPQSARRPNLKLSRPGPVSQGDACIPSTELPSECSEASDAILNKSAPRKGNLVKSKTQVPTQGSSVFQK